MVLGVIEGWSVRALDISGRDYEAGSFTTRSIQQVEGSALLRCIR